MECPLNDSDAFLNLFDPLLLLGGFISFLGKNKLHTNE